MASALALVQKSLSKGHTWHKVRTDMGALRHVKTQCMSRTNHSDRSCTQNEALDAILYLRVLSAIIAGLTAGILGLEGFYIFAG